MHVPVLLNETLEYLASARGEKFIDGTVGGGGHTSEILARNQQARVLGIDWDQVSLEKLKAEFVQRNLSSRVILVSGNYKDLYTIAAAENFTPVDGILLDLGFSSLQLDDPTRGLSFQMDGPLDMRYSSDNSLTAAEIVNKYPIHQLEKILREYGEEKFGKRIAAGVIKSRQLQPLNSTRQLAEVVTDSLPGQVRFKATDSLRRVFQALRIEVNHELDNLTTALPEALKTLKPGGRLVIISFHSLEDRIVKEFFLKEAKDCVCPPEFPTCVCDKASTLRILTRKPIIASEKEGQENSRSKSAKLRAAEKI